MVTVCQHEQCGKKVHAKGLCSTHYRAARRRKAGVVPRPSTDLPGCGWAGCDGPSVHKGWCQTHYQRLLTGSEPKREPTARDEQGRKQCGRCRAWLPVDQYGVARKLPDGLNSSCKPCCRQSHYVRKYGLMGRDVAQLVESQQGHCGLCRRPVTRPHIDHDHETGKVRGVLCGTCNQALGLLGDDPARCLAAALYLLRSGKQVPADHAVAWTDDLAACMTTELGQGDALVPIVCEPDPPTFRWGTVEWA